MLTSEASYAIETFPLLDSFRFYDGNCSMSHNVGFVFPESNTVFEMWPLWHFWVPVSLPTQAQVAISWVFLNKIWKPYSWAEECWLSRKLGAKIKPQPSSQWARPMPPPPTADTLDTLDPWEPLKLLPFPQLFPFTYVLRLFVPRPLSPGWLTLLIHTSKPSVAVLTQGLAMRQH